VGPVYVEEADEGDLLAVHVRGIRLTRDSATSELIPNFGSLTGEWSGHNLLYNDPLPSIPADSGVGLDPYPPWAFILSSRGIYGMSKPK
jgi:hypothetical protein